MATTQLAIDSEILSGISKSVDDFDLNAPLTRAELAAVGMLTVLPEEHRLREAPPVKDLDDVEDDSNTDAVAEFIDGSSYNSRYAHYLKCQALAALVAFEEGWNGFEELVLKPYLTARRRENKDYKGDNPNTAFSLRVREQTAEDFVRFIRVVAAEAVNMPKPALGKKQ